jgi:oligopeptide/dipeptide ABC transporter ATP-binding protein
MSDVLLSVKHLTTRFFTRAGVVHAVEDVSFDLERGTTMALVGESGSGKSVTSLSIVRLVAPPGEIVAGRILFNGRDLLTLPEDEMRRIRGRDIGVIFQDPMTSLNPVYTVGEQIAEVVRAHFGSSRRAARAAAVEMLERVRIPDASRRAAEYPHQLSGGMRQRVMIAIALACKPALLIADEPTTALDVTIQAEILDLLRALKDEYRLTLLLITHDLGVVAQTADRVCVMYAGRIVEEAGVRELFRSPRHPYTEALLRSIPRVEHGNGARRLLTIEGTVPSLLDAAPGCEFAPRCRYVIDACRENDIPTISLEDGARVRCIRHDPSETERAEFMGIDATRPA